MRVLSVQHYPMFGGPYNEALEFEDYFRSHGVHTILAMTAQPGTAYPRVKDRLDHTLLPLDRLRWSKDARDHLRTARRFPGDVQRLRALIRAHEIDVVRVHGPQNPHGAVAARLEGRPVVWVLSSDVLPAPLRRLGMTYVRRLAGSVLVCGQELIQKHPGIPAERVFVYYPPVDVNRFRPLSSTEIASVKEELGVPAGCELVGMVGNITRQKGVEIFLRAAAAVRSRRPGVRFVLVGSMDSSQAAYVQRMRALAEELGLVPPTLRFVGFRGDVERVVGAFDVKLISSWWEGTTTTAAEALACGVPVVATDVGAVGGAVIDGATGYRVPAGSSQALAARVLQLLANPEERQSLGSVGRAHVSRLFAPGTGGAQQLSAYRAALASVPGDPLSSRRSAWSSGRWSVGRSRDGPAMKEGR